MIEMDTKSCDREDGKLGLVRVRFGQSQRIFAFVSSAMKTRGRYPAAKDKGLLLLTEASAWIKAGRHGHCRDSLWIALSVPVFFGNEGEDKWWGVSENRG